LSSRVVYKKIGEFGHLTENSKEKNKEGSSAIYGRTKARIEQLVNEATLDGRVIGVNARLFTFYGPISNLQSPISNRLLQFPVLSIAQ
jgi:nucleoside-diphosphate-sugar epimerase